jgi:hypothetical protein
MSRAPLALLVGRVVAVDAEGSAAVVVADAEVLEVLALERPERLRLPVQDSPLQQLWFLLSRLQRVRRRAEEEAAAVAALAVAGVKQVAVAAAVAAIAAVVVQLRPLRFPARRSSTCCLRPVSIQIRNSTCVVPAIREDASAIPS